MAINLPSVSVRNIFFIGTLVVLTFLFAHAVIIPQTTHYLFQTVTKFQGIYPNPIYITFHWDSQDELMVGKKILVSAEIRDLPYTSNQTLSEIKMKFNGLNYFSNPDDLTNNRISKVDTITFKPYWDEHVFRSNQIQIRYILPEDESVELYDYNISPSNMTINGIIHPAPHDTFVQIDTARANAGVSIAVLVATVVIVWSALTPDKSEQPKVSPSRNQKTMIIVAGVVLVILILAGYLYKIFVGDVT